MSLSLGILCFLEIQKQQGLKASPLSALVLKSIARSTLSVDQNFMP